MNNKCLLAAFALLTSTACSNEELFKNLFSQPEGGEEVADLSTPKDGSATDGMQPPPGLLWREDFAPHIDELFSLADNLTDFNSSFLSLNSKGEEYYWTFRRGEATCSLSPDPDSLNKKNHLTFHYKFKSSGVVNPKTLTATIIFKNPSRQKIEDAILVIRQYVPEATNMDGFTVVYYLLDEALQRISEQSKIIKNKPSMDGMNQQSVNMGFHVGSKVIRGIQLEYKESAQSPANNEAGCLRISKLQLCATKSETECPL